MTARIALCVTYYNNPRMLARQLHEWSKYPEHVREAFEFVIVDDGSAQPASDVLLFDALSTVSLPTLYRIDDDIPWNQHGARNLAAQQIECPWLLMLDVDHVLTAENAERIADHRDAFDMSRWFRFPRERIGAEDETRTKDSTLRGIRPELSGVTVNPAMNCYLVTRDAYWQAGGYNEDFCGTYGGDSQFLNYLRDVAGEPVVLNDVWLQVHTRYSVPDANERTLDRDPSPFRKRLAEAKRNGTVRGHEPYCRFEWRRVL
jgi:hypothetical protein